jgi:glucose-6-phosphate 1-dehydrogenase
MNDRKPAVFVLFGATGDLAQRKIMPALCSLYASGALPEDSDVIAFSRRPWSDAEYRAFIQPSLAAFPADAVQKFLSRVRYVQGTFDDPDAFLRLKEQVGAKEAFYHLAIQPEFYATAIMQLGAAGLAGTILIEKPFGHDLATAQELENHIEEHFDLAHIERVDHYLGKGGLDALLERRRTDPAFEASLSSEQVASVSCRLLENLDLEGRGEFYDAVGALKDVGQNHLLMMLASALMDIPQDPEAIPGARARALQALAVEKGGAVRGQYEGYAQEEGVQSGSQTETYFKLNTASADPRWKGVEIALEAGKALHEKKSEIEILYKDGRREAFDMERPRTRDAYEAVIEAALRGDHSRFAGREEVLAAWTFTDQAASVMRAAPLVAYAKGSTGPHTER